MARILPPFSAAVVRARRAVVVVVFALAALVALPAAAAASVPFMWNVGLGGSSPLPVSFTTPPWTITSGATAVATVPGSTDILYLGYFVYGADAGPEFAMADSSTTRFATPTGGSGGTAAWFGRRRADGKWLWVNGWRSLGNANYDDGDIAVSGDGSLGYVVGSWRPAAINVAGGAIPGVVDFAFLGPNPNQISLPYGLLGAADGFDPSSPGPQTAALIAGFDPTTGAITWARTGDTKRGRNGQVISDVEVASDGSAIVGGRYVEDLRICAAGFLIGGSSFSCPAGVNEAPDSDHTYDCCTGAESNAVVAKLAGDGSVTWVTGWGATWPNYSIAFRSHTLLDLTVLPDGAVMVAGSHREQVPQKRPPFPGLSGAYDTGNVQKGLVAKLSAGGVWQWVRLMGTGEVRGVSAIPDAAPVTDILVAGTNGDAAGTTWTVPQVGGGTLQSQLSKQLITGRIVARDSTTPSNEGDWRWLDSMGTASGLGVMRGQGVGAYPDGSGVFLTSAFNRTSFGAFTFGTVNAFAGLPAGGGDHPLSSVAAIRSSAGTWTWAGAVGPAGSTLDGSGDTWPNDIAIGNDTAYIAGYTSVPVRNVSLLPGTPAPVATPGNTQAVIAWDTPSTNGGAAIASYTATVTSTGQTCTVSEPTRACTFTGLTNGTQYTVTVVATNADGGVGQAGSTTVTPRTVPTAPRSVSASAGNTQAVVTWSAPASDGGSAVTGYTATAVGSGRSCTASAPTTSCTITGLTNGTTYPIEVTATNAAGSGAASAQVNVTPKGPPTAPLAVSASPGNGQASISWSVPASDGGAAILSYTATASPGGQSCTATAPTTSCVITGLTNGTAYSVTVTATNAAGEGAASAAAAVTPRTVPGAPTGVAATARTERARISWSAPSDNGGSAVTSYTATMAGSGETCTASAPATTCTITGLTAGQAYSVSVVAANAAGSGAASATVSVTPLPVPGAPVNVQAAPRDSATLVSWNPPTPNGSLDITSYTATISGSGQSCTATAPAASCTITGLTNGTTYSVTVTASNGEATGAASSPASVTPSVPPGAPTITRVTAGDGQATVAWSAPSSTGGTPLTGYRVEVRDMNQGAVIIANACTSVPPTTQCTVSGLTNGGRYQVRVYAANASGDSAPSSWWAAYPVGVPGAPTAISAAPLYSGGSSNLVVSWQAPANNGGAIITRYNVTGTASGYPTATCSTPFGTSCTLSSLVAGVTYAIAVTATNSVGTGSSGSGSATAVGRPGTPTMVSATGADSSAVVSWAAPSSDGGSPITGYTATDLSSGRTCTAAAPATSCTITGLTNGVGASIEVSASNGYADSLGSAVVFVTPVGPPAAPTGVSAQAGYKQITVRWAAPGDSVARWTATATPGNFSCTRTNPGPLSCSITGLTNGTTYTVTVTATNGGGTSPASSAVTAMPFVGSDRFDAVANGLTAIDVTWAGLAGVNFGDGGSWTQVTATTHTGGTCTAPYASGGCTISGLASGATYAVTAVGVWSTRGSIALAGAEEVVLGTLPDPPTSVTATRLLDSASVSWAPPASSGTSAVSSYTATAQPGGQFCSVAAPSTTCTITGLTGGSAYTVSVTATSSVGTGAASSTAGVTPLALPGAPTITSMTPGNTTATITWFPPASDGGSPVTSYTAVVTGGASCTVSAPATSCTISGLTNGTTYTAAVSATTAAGTGPTSVTSTVTPRTVPGAPTSPSASPGAGQATVAWVAPASDGGSAITGYTATAQPGGRTCTASSSATSCVITGLANGTQYTVTITAENAAGSSSLSPSQTVTPRTVPGAPVQAAPVPGDTQATISWVAPASDGGSAITGYTATAQPGGHTCTAGPSATSCVMTGLTNGTQYTVTITAENAAGSSSLSSSQTVTPRTVPGAPTSPSASPGAGQATITWAAPASDGGSAITGYTATAQPGGHTCTAGPSATSCVMTGLTAGTTYTVTTVAINAAGPSAASSAASVTPIAGLPTAPGTPTVATGNQFADVSWLAPASDGGIALTVYTVTAQPGGRTCTATAPATTCRIASLTNGTNYAFTVSAANAQGTGPDSAAAQGTPSTVPGPPTDPAATPGTGQVSIAWTAPASDGGAAVTSYIVTAGPGGTQCAVVAPSTTCTISGLIPGVEYTFTIVALNASGSSVASSVVRATPSAAAVIAPVVVELPSFGAPQVAGPPAPQPDRKGDIVEVPSGEARYIYADGMVRPTPMVVRETSSGPRLVAGNPADFAMALKGNEPKAALIDPVSQRLIFNTGKKGVATGRGFKPGTEAEVWLFSDPVFLGYADVQADGTFSREFLVPPDVPEGNHTIQAEGISKNGSPRAVSAGVVVRGGVARIRTVRFAVAFPPDSAYLAPAYRKAIRRIAGARVLSVHVEGFVHPTPRAEGDIRLSRERAQAVSNVFRAADRRSPAAQHRAGVKHQIGPRGRRASTHAGCRLWLNRCAVVTVVRSEKASAPGGEKRAKAMVRAEVSGLPAGPPVPAGR